MCVPVSGPDPAPRIIFIRDARQAAYICVHVHVHVYCIVLAVSEQDDMFTLESAAKRAPVRMRPAQLNARAIGRVFNHFPESVFLVAGDGIELPNEDGAFQVNAMDSSLVWTCDGDSSKPLDQDAGE